MREKRDGGEGGAVLSTFLLIKDLVYGAVNQVITIIVPWYNHWTHNTSHNIEFVPKPIWTCLPYDGKLAKTLLETKRFNTHPMMVISATTNLRCIHYYLKMINRPQKPQIWCYIMVRFLNHITSILSERGLRCGAVYHPLYFKTHKEPLVNCSWDLKI